VGVEVDSPIPGYGEVVGSATPDGEVATVMHLGPYDRLHEAHGAITRWCSDHGHPLAGPNWEIYGHWRDEWNNDPGKIETQVCYLLKRDAGSAD